MANAVTKAADTVEQAVEDFAGAAAKAPNPMLFQSNDPLSGSPVASLIVPAMPSKRAQRKRSKKPNNKKAKAAAKKKAKKTSKKKATINKRL